ncbi:MAG: exodeoxyribonuclease VII large subunit [Verrucomicrobiae bacterium]|nr:exodeoxyribonuclease VII large subunit [Verrucomicrobiae bacterium]
MPKRARSQWDFGELFPTSATRRVFSVAEVTARIKEVLERQVGEVWVSGEVSNLRLQASGHAYFTLKDASAQLSCVLFRGTAVEDRGVLRDGQRLVVRGEVSVYEPRGQYQLIVRELEAQGQGALQAAFERLKRKLEEEGLFAPARKRPIPRYPRRVGLVTSPTGAALQDVLHVMERRYAGIELVLAGCRVQGAGAEQEIAGALQALGGWSAARPDGEGLDAILVTRGGGSLEDLWAFNEEVVARAIAASPIPVVSAVGHEIDFTIADFVADLRAATPSAAAELLTAGYVEAGDRVRRQGRRLQRLAETAWERVAERFERLARRLQRSHPRRRLQERMQRLDEAQSALTRRVRETLRHWAMQWRQLDRRLSVNRPTRRLDAARERCRGHAAALRAAIAGALRERRERLARLALRLELLSPERVLKRGYSITVEAGSGRVVRQAIEVEPGTLLRTRLAQGEVRSVVTAAPSTE